MFLEYITVLLPNSIVLTTVLSTPIILTLLTLYT